MITFKNIHDSESAIVVTTSIIGVLLLILAIVLLSRQFIAWEAPSNELLRFSLIPLVLLAIAGRINYLEQKDKQ